MDQYHFKFYNKINDCDKFDKILNLIENKTQELGWKVNPEYLQCIQQLEDRQRAIAIYIHGSGSLRFELRKKKNFLTTTVAKIYIDYDSLTLECKSPGTEFRSLFDAVSTVEKLWATHHTAKDLI
jgi:hypothetical protein